MSIRGKFVLWCIPVLLTLGFLSGCGGAPSDPTVGYKLAAIDGDLGGVSEYEEKVAQAAERCGESEISVADKSVALTQYLETRGISESNLWVLNGVLQAIPPSEAGTVDCTEVISLLGVLRIEE